MMQYVYSMTFVKLHDLKDLEFVRATTRSNYSDGSVIKLEYTKTKIWWTKKKKKEEMSIVMAVNLFMVIVYLFILYFSTVQHCKT